MNEKQDRRPSEPEAPRKRFHIEKLEERIAPAKGGNATKRCDPAPTGGETCGGSSASTIF